MSLTQTKKHNLHDPIAACGDRVYSISSQNGLFPDSWGGHVPGEMTGVWNHPIKLLDGFWFGVGEGADAPPRWLSEASECRAHLGYNEFDYRVGPLQITRRDCVPDGVEGMVVTLTIRTTEAHPGPISLYALFRSDLRAAWLGEEAGMVDGKDSTTIRDGLCTFTDAANPWTCIVGADHAPTEVASGTDLWAVNRTQGNGISALLTYSLSFDASLRPQPIPAGEGGLQIHFFVAGSAASQAEATSTYWKLYHEHAQLIAAKIASYEQIMKTSQLLTPDVRLNNAASWSKIITQMFAREVPQCGRGVGAGMPEYPWWFGIDTEYAVLPMLQSGQFELVRDTLRLLKRHSEAQNPDEPGRVLHEMSSVGIVFNKGNTVEVPVFIRAVHQYFLWTGDRDFLREMYDFCKRGLMEYALGTHDSDSDLCPSGRSIIETVEMHAGFEVIDVAAYTCEALTRLADMTRSLSSSDAKGTGGEEEAKRYEDLAGRLAKRIREEWWLEGEGLFADVRASKNDVVGVLNDLEQKAREQGWLVSHQIHIDTARKLFEPELIRHTTSPDAADLAWLLKHWVILCPVEVGIATPEQARRVLDRLQDKEFSNEWGMYLHPDRHDVMSINTGLLALSAARYGHVDEALATVNKLVRAFGYRTPGAVCEAVPGDWCFLQLWSNVGLVSPAIECFLGIEPRAHERAIFIKPNLPADWPWAVVRQLRVGDAMFDIRVDREGDGYRIDVRGGDGWTVIR
jgi:glycogen debranching enzyme